MTSRCLFSSLFLILSLPALRAAAEGADHWAWQPLATHDHQKNIDGFIQARLRAKGMKLSPEADRRTLLRRLSFDLHGLPPSPELVREFVEDSDPAAYEKLVDRMLASPHYGERFAQHWLDIAHYADTHGFERDRRRPHAWRYRDYVITSFNEDKAYHRFLQEQIAGDVLWPDDEQAVIATGFLAAGPWDFVGQAETKSPILRRAARSLDLDDMATQVMTSSLAMTVNCARCHDHKLDPISQKEYYQLRTVFAGLKRGDREFPTNARGKYLAARTKLLENIQLLAPGLDLADIVGGGEGRGTGTFRHGLDVRSGGAESKPMGYLANVRPNHFSKSDHPFIDGVFVPKGEGGQATIPVSSTGLTITGITGADAKAWDLIRNGPVNSQHSPALAGITFDENGESLLGLHANAGITFDLAPARIALGAATMRFTAQVGYFGHLNDKAFADVRVFVDGVMVTEFRTLKRGDGLKTIEIPLSKEARFLTLLSTDGGNGISMDQVGFGNPKLSVSRQLSPSEQKLLLNSRKEMQALNAKISALQSPRVYAVVAEKKNPEVRVLQRGDSESPVGDPLPPRAISLLQMLDPDLGALGTSQGERRAALARWITHQDNPLTPRVIANRLWQWHFGQGLVNTPSDFGHGGDQPSHPELLDWLAAELLEKKWSLKALHRLILTSATYKQESRYVAGAPGISQDAGNRLLWRQNARRIEAEAVRDAVLAVSGKLNTQAGGPGFEDFKYKEAYAPEYTYLTADQPALWRRSIYRYRVRTTPNRFLTTLDCPDPANFTPTRLTTTTPLQSLALYNNDFILRQARYFAERIAQEAGPRLEDQVTHAFALALARTPSARELRLGREFIIEQSLFAFCRSLINANEFVYVD